MIWFDTFFNYKKVRSIYLYYRESIHTRNWIHVFCSLCLASRSWKILSGGSQFLLSLMFLFYKRTLYGLSTGKVLLRVSGWLARRKFMGCEGQFEQPADGVQNRHVTFLLLHLYIKKKSHYHQENKTPVQKYLKVWVVVAWFCVP